MPLDESLALFQDNAYEMPSGMGGLSSYTQRAVATPQPSLFTAESQIKALSSAVQNSQVRAQSLQQMTNMALADMRLTQESTILDQAYKAAQELKDLDPTLSDYQERKNDLYVRLPWAFSNPGFVAQIHSKDRVFETDVQFRNQMQKQSDENAAILKRNSENAAAITARELASREAIDLRDQTRAERSQMNALMKLTHPMDQDSINEFLDAETESNRENASVATIRKATQMAQALTEAREKENFLKTSSVPRDKWTTDDKFDAKKAEDYYRQIKSDRELYGQQLDKQHKYLSELRAQYKEDPSDEIKAALDSESKRMAALNRRFQSTFKQETEPTVSEGTGTSAIAIPSAPTNVDGAPIMGKQLNQYTSDERDRISEYLDQMAAIQVGVPVRRPNGQTIPYTQTEAESAKSYVKRFDSIYVPKDKRAAATSVSVPKVVAVKDTTPETLIADPTKQVSLTPEDVSKYKVNKNYLITTSANPNVSIDVYSMLGTLDKVAETKAEQEYNKQISDLAAKGKASEISSLRERKADVIRGLTNKYSYDDRLRPDSELKDSSGKTKPKKQVIVDAIAKPIDKAILFVQKDMATKASDSVAVQQLSEKYDLLVKERELIARRVNMIHAMKYPPLPIGGR